MTPRITFVVAMAENRIIGRAGGLPWRLPADLAHFKRLTLGHTVLMGRAVYDSIGRPLPERRNLVLSRNPDVQAPGCTVVHSPEAALRAASDVPELMVIGGEQVYRLFLDRVERVELTLVHARVEGDTSFPELPGAWWEEARRDRPADERNAYALSFLTLRRGGAAG